jgi:lipooligosaccharide transport system permease protein
LLLFSGTFFPITLYPQWLQSIIMVTPLWQAIAMMRSLAFGIFDGALVVHVVYFVVLAAGGLVLTTRRMNALFLR